MNYITHTRYNGLDINGNNILIRRKKQLNRIGDILYYENIPICIYRSQVAKEHFVNEDGDGLKRGDLIHKIAFSNVRHIVNNHLQRFTEKQIEILCSDKWKKYINPFNDTIIFSDAFYEASLQELNDLYSELEVDNV